MCGCVLIEGFPEGGSYRDSPSEWANVEGGKIFFRGSPRIGGIEKRRRNREFRSDVHGCFARPGGWLKGWRGCGDEVKIKLRS